MKLPSREKAYIPLRKLTGYLLSETHPIGRTKAAFFRSMGFNEENMNLLSQELLAIAQSEDVGETEPSPYGTKYTIEAGLTTPIGSVVEVRTVWILEMGDDRPRFVTAYPL